MASDSREEGAVTVDLPAELDEWLDDRAATLDVDREDVIVQLLASYHAASSLDGDIDAEAVLGDDAADVLDVEGVVDDCLDERLDDRIEERLDAIESEFQEKIVDVRERVIQVKQEADGKAPADHDHEAFERIDDLEGRLEDLSATIDQLEGTIEGVRADLEADPDGAVETQDAIEDRLSDTEDKLKRVAWVVSDLKDEAGGRDAYEQAVARIKHAAAQEGVTSADCERCGEAVDVALLTDPECPHCSATVSDVRPSGGIFRTKATLVAAAQLESGEE